MAALSLKGMCLECILTFILLSQVVNYIIPQVATEVKGLLNKNERGPGAATPVRSPLTQIYIREEQPRLLEHIDRNSK